MNPRFTTEWVDRNVVVVNLPFEGADDRFDFLITSDAHWDNQHCNRKMFRRHLDEVVKRDAGWIDNGDMYCLMQGKWDARKDQEQLREEHKVNNYPDKVRRDFIEWVEPYAKHAIAFGHGNHETGFINHNGTDMTAETCQTLRDLHGSGVRSHWIQGWVLFRCIRAKQRQTIRLFRHHGHGGNAPVSKGVLTAPRMGLVYPDADVVVTGHNHASWVFPVARQRISQQGRVFHDEQLHLKIPGYKATPPNAKSPWEHVKGQPPQPNGAIWLRISRGGRDESGRFRVDAARAK